jgi:cyclopropane-fatty-acyl-phospholipid synthase
MMQTQAPAEVHTSVAVLRAIFGDRLGRDFAVEFWEGTRIGASGAPFTLRVNAPGALRVALSPPLELNAGRAFAAGLLDCDGDLEQAVDLFFDGGREIAVTTALTVQRLLRRLPRAAVPALREARLHGALHSRRRDLEAISFHYDLPVEFYRTFLSTPMVYSCAYFESDGTTLEAAQLGKMELIARKLRLHRGERLLDIGCGWGALPIYAAKRYGVHALGVTLSRRQFEQARADIEREGVEGLVSVEMRDYRDLGDETFDKIASVGMFEHVGRAKMPEYFAKARALLRPGGLFLNHGIARQGPRGRGSGFIERFVFPDGELLSAGDALQIAEAAGWELRDVENLREHYTRTLRAWVRNLEANRGVAAAAAGEQAYRVWRLYMAASAQGFRSGRLGLYQMLFAKPQADGDAGMPLTRRDLYRNEAV